MSLTLEQRKARYEKRCITMVERHGAVSVCKPTQDKEAEMHLTDWFPDPDVPAEHGVKMRILRGT